MYSLLKPFLFALDPETAHDIIKKSSHVLPSSLFRTLFNRKNDRLKATLGNAALDNPIGLAAGFDKNAEMVSFLRALGFGFLELGSVTRLKSEGNPRPRIFRLPKDQSLINRMGLPNVGVEAFVRNFKKAKKNIPLGINIAKTPDFANGTAISSGKALDGVDDYLASYEKLAPLNPTYIVFNLSCPNTADAETFEDPATFAKLSKAIFQARRKMKNTVPVFFKLSPELRKESVLKLVEKACEDGADGFVVSNTSPNRAGLVTSKKEIEKKGRGGLSGRAISGLANAQIRRVNEACGGKKTIVGAGGLVSFEDLLAKISAGASLFEVYTGLIYNGPFFIHDLCDRLNQFCEKEGVKNYRELVGEKLK